MEIKLAERSLYNLLEVAAERKEPIITELKHRELGKTTALIEFAKDNGYTVLVGNGTIARHLSKEHGYAWIKSIRSNCMDGHKGFVFDECCPTEFIEKMIKQGRPILTGFKKSVNFYRSEGSSS